MATASVDTSYIAASYSIPEPTLQTLLANPSLEQIQDLLSKIEEKAREHESLQAEKLRSDVELETCVQNGNRRAKQLKESVDKSQKEVEELRKTLSSEETTRASLESELQSIKSSTTNSSSELQTLKSRISALETSNTDALSLLEAKTIAHDKLSDELSAHQKKAVALRRELADAEEKRQAAENASMSAKFREQSLQQEVELLKKNNEWHEKELKHRGSEHTKYRKEKSAQISELNRTLEDVNQANASLQSTEMTLRDRATELDRRLNDALEQIQSKNEEAINRETSFRAELENATRLAELQRKSAETARSRQRELEEELNELKDHAATEIGNLQADINAERGDKEVAERRVADLETVRQELEVQLAAAREVPSRPSTPRRGPNGVAIHNTPGRNGSPGLTSTPGGTRLKAPLTVTQIYSDYSKVKAELEAERRDTEELRKTNDEYLDAMQQLEPQFEELQMANASFAQEVQELGTLLEQATKERDGAKKAARIAEGKCSGLNAQINLLRQQTRDLGTQVKILMVELQAREQGLEPMSEEERAQLEQAARGELDDDTIDTTPTARLISQRLVIFRNIEELQNRNQKLLELTRHLGEEMEGEDAKAKKAQREADEQELESLRARITQYQDLIKQLTTQSESFVKERDMFRRIVAHRGNLPPGTDIADVFAQSVDGSFMAATPSRAHSVEPSADARALSDHIKLLRELQQHFDSYKEEAATDRRALKDRIDQLEKAKSEAQSENAKYLSQLTLTQERTELLRSNFDMAQADNRELSNRLKLISDNAGKQDIRTQQVAEELVEAKGLIDSMRHENANLKAEKDLWKSIDERRTQEYDSLTAERNRLSKMLSDVQSLQNERDLENGETRRRLQARVDGLESELSTVKRKLDEEVEQSKKASLRREYEHEQNRTRIEDLLKSSSNYKEELVKAKTQRDALQSQVDELKIELRNAEEKAQALQPRPTTHPGVDTETDENALTREQELAIEVADLKRDLELKQAELQQAQEEIEQYKAIAQASEESLQNLNETHDQYREETDQVLEENNTKIQELEKRVEEISSELATAHTELSETRSKAEEATSRLSEEKTRYESELAALRDECERLATSAKFHQEDLKKQTEISQQAQQNYEDELVKHANTTESLHKIREQYNQVKTEVATSKADAESAKVSLAQNEESWAERRNQYEQEITEAKTRREGVDAQNQRLMKQVEDISSQIKALKDNRATNGEDAARAGTPAGDPDSNTQEIIRYLREEKTITEMQMDLCQRESKRLKGELDHTKAQLEQTREKLEEERRTQVAKAQNATTHTQLMQTINELNLNRESNVTLRSQYESAQKQLNLKIKEVDDLIAQLEPVQTRVREVEHELESRDGELKLLQEDRDRWQKRTQDIMQKYDRVDPAELEGFKTQISTLEAERDSLITAKEELESSVEGKITTAVTAAQEKSQEEWSKRRLNIIEQSKTKVRELTEQIKKLNSQVATLNENETRMSLDLHNANEELSKIKNELEQTRVARDQAFEQVNQKATTPADTAEEGQLHEGLSEEAKAAFETRITNSVAQANAEAEKAANLEQELQRVQAQAQGLNSQVDSLQQLLEAANAQVSTMQNEPAPPQDSASSEELDNIKSELAAKQREIEALKATADVAASSHQTPEDGSKPVAELVKEQVEQISSRLTEEHTQRIAEEEEKYKKRADSMKTQLSKKLSEAKQSIREEAKTEHDKAIEQLKSEHLAELERLRLEHREEIQVLKAQGGATTSVPPDASNGTVAGSGPKLSELTHEQLRELLQTNTQVKAIIRGNVESGIKKQTAQIKQEEQKTWSAKLDEIEKAAEESKRNAVELEGKKMKVKLSMLENRGRTMTAQINVVKKAADETPQRAVGEVWEEAKTAKAPPAAPPASTSATPSTNPAAPVPVTQQPSQTNAPPTPSPAPSTPVATNAAPPIPINRSSGPPTGPVQSQPGGSLPVGRGTTPFVNTQQPPSGPSTNQQQQQTNMPRPAQAVGTGPGALKHVLNQNQGPNLNSALNQPLSSGIPRGGAIPRGTRGGFQVPGRGGMHPQQQQQGSGHQQQHDLNVAGAARGGSNLPRGPGPAGRGGRGRGQVNIHGHQGQQGGPNSPGGGRGGLNPGAKQFNPGVGVGIKRPHEGGEGGNAEKKARGQGD
ncbi:hypothetical protein E2P81_ATG08487 [Venturia nashicola]|uniref:Uncharacterized protein n=1 Tax=Venturia nashicola TaxID=86259 RepID=A0A4Z1NJ32_9PEZI|nr:hypothetical protein E6O75_ATG08681 [Venturia nashicola]TLD20823.1 hypothetical protein E2P81_ATG08487 [Venturia nashicola]